MQQGLSDDIEARAGAARSVSPVKMRLLRSAYGTLAIAVMALFGWLSVGPVQDMFGQATEAAGLSAPTGMSAIAMASVGVGGAAFLAWRPYWWGKLVCALAALSWLGHAATSAFVLPTVVGADFPATLHAAVVGGCGLVALATGIAHQWVDPRFGGTYLRAD